MTCTERVPACMGRAARGTCTCSRAVLPGSTRARVLAALGHGERVDIATLAEAAGMNEASVRAGVRGLDADNYVLVYNATRRGMHGARVTVVITSRGRAALEALPIPRAGNGTERTRSGGG